MKNIKEIPTTTPFSMEPGTKITISGASDFKLNLWGKIKQFLIFWRKKKGSYTYNGTYKINKVTESNLDTCRFVCDKEN